MTEAADITANLLAIGRLHSRIDSVGTGCAGTLNASMLGTLDAAHRTAADALEDYVIALRAAVTVASPTVTDSEAIQQLRAALDQALGKLDSVLFDVVAAAEA